MEKYALQAKRDGTRGTLQRRDDGLIHHALVQAARHVQTLPDARLMTDERYLKGTSCSAGGNGHGFPSSKSTTCPTSA